VRRAAKFVPAAVLAGLLLAAGCTMPGLPSDPRRPVSVTDLRPVLETLEDEQMKQMWIDAEARGVLPRLDAIPVPAPDETLVLHDRPVIVERDRSGLQRRTAARPVFGVGGPPGLEIFNPAGVREHSGTLQVASLAPGVVAGRLDGSGEPFELHFQLPEGEEIPELSGSVPALPGFLNLHFRQDPVDLVMQTQILTGFGNDAFLMGMISVGSRERQLLDHELPLHGDHGLLRIRQVGGGDEPAVRLELPGSGFVSEPIRQGDPPVVLGPPGSPYRAQLMSSSSRDVRTGFSDDDDACHVELLLWKGKPAETHAAFELRMRDLVDPVVIGGNTIYEIIVRNTGDRTGTNVTLELVLPASMQYLEASGPTAVIPGEGRVFANLGDLAAGADAMYRVTVRADAPGAARMLVILASTDLGGGSVEETESTNVVQESFVPRDDDPVSDPPPDPPTAPVVRILASPDPVPSGQLVRYRVEIEATGSVALENLRLRFQHPEAARVEATHGPLWGDIQTGAIDFGMIGRVEPGAIAAYEIDLRAGVPGPLVVSATIEARGLAAPLVVAATTEVLPEERPALPPAMRLYGPPEAAAGDGMTFEIEVVNPPGNRDLRQLRVVLEYSPDAELVEVRASSAFTRRKEIVEFAPIDRLAGGDVLNFFVKLRIPRASRFELQASVSGTGIVDAVRQLHSVDVLIPVVRRDVEPELDVPPYLPPPVILIESIDTVDPVAVGAETEYQVTLTNLGATLARDLEVRFEYPAANMTIEAVTGSFTVQTDDPGRMSFHPLPELASGGSAKLTIRVRTTAAGDVRVKSIVDGPGFAKPIEESDSTTIF